MPKKTRRLSNKQINFKLRKLVLTPTDEKLTDAAGLGTLMEAFDSTPFSKEFAKCLPKRLSNRSFGSYRLGLIQMASFIYGHDCLDDLEEFQKDPSLEAVLRGELVVPKTMGDFLRDFKEEHIEALNGFLARMSKSIRKHLKETQPDEYKPGSPVMDIDSTPHVQHADQMEGLAWNYDNLWCLDSQVVFDELGLCSNLDLRSGNTKSGVGAVEQMESVFKNYSYQDEKYFRADAAYCNQDVMKTCLSLGAKFTLTANEATTGWEKPGKAITEWEPWKWSQKQRKKATKRGRELPKVEVGKFLWQPSWNDSLRFHVVVKRTWIDREDLFGSGEWKYYGVVTNFNLYFKTAQEVIEFHSKRGNAENFIREEKYGYDLKHFPCQKLIANHAFCLLAMVANNMLRWAALVKRPDKPHYSKKLRRRFIFIPGKVVSHARQLFLKIPIRYYEEVKSLKEALQLCQNQSAFNTS